MSYPRDLDEIPEAELVRELALRRERRAFELCDYCGRPPNTPPCKFPERHKAPLPTVCKGCGFTRAACDQAKAAGALKCCPECKHE